jgi:hypothetical protein
MYSTTLLLPTVLLATLVACGRDERPGANAAATQPEARCFRSVHSVLLGPPTPTGQQGTGPGWLRLSGSAESDSGMVSLVDADGKRLQGTFRRQGTTLRIVAFDDFLRVEMTLMATGGGLAGEGKAHSDATLEPDASGRVGELRRTWPFAGAVTPCEAVPEDKGESSIG